MRHLLCFKINDLELARVGLSRPKLTVGRSPTCDVVLRAPGIRPVHYLLEWIGAGEFTQNTQPGDWVVIDLSKSKDGSGEGRILGAAGLTFEGISLSWTTDRLESKDLGGRIAENMREARSSEIAKPDLVEFVQMRSDSGALEEVVHLEPGKSPAPLRPSREIHEFALRWDLKQGERLVEVLLDEMKGAEVLLDGKLLAKAEKVNLRGGEILEVRWKDRTFWLRLVAELKPPKLPRKSEPLLRRVALAVLLVLALILLFIRVLSGPTSSDLVKLPHVVKIELEPDQTLLSVPTPPRAADDGTESPAVTEAITPPDASPAEAPAAAAAPAQAAAPAPRDVSQLGLLKSLSKNSAPTQANPAQSARTRELLQKQDESIAGAASAGAVVVKRVQDSGTASGTVDNGAKKGDPLKAAQSGGSGAAKYGSAFNANSVKTGATSAGLGGDRSGGLDGAQTNRPGGAVNTGFSVEGGLDRDAVARVVRSHRGEIRNCYERELLTTPGLAGRATVEWRILPDGKVEWVKTNSSTFGNERMQSCLEGVVAKMKFPETPGNRATKVLFPFTFQPVQ